MIPSEFLPQIDRALVHLRAGGVVAFPTDTLYGLGADIFCQDAVMRVFHIKGKESHTPLPVLLADPSDLEEVAVDIPPVAYELIQRFWPGPLTLVLKRAPRVPALVSGDRDTIGVRVPDHPVPRALARGLGRPITGTSANPTGRRAAITAAQVRSYLGSAVDYVIDGGRCPTGKASTVLDLTASAPRVLREGTVSAAALQPFFAILVGVNRG